MGKNIVICADGTANAFTGERSNVARLVRLLAKGDDAAQMVAYDQGIGTDMKRARELRAVERTDPEVKGLHVLPGPPESWWGRERWELIAGLVKGDGLRENVQQIYEWLSTEHGDDSDRIYLFGFSRGAFTVRALAGLIFRCGLPAENAAHEPGEFDAAWKFYQPMQVDEAAKNEFWRKTCPRRCRIHFLGLWDTVKSYGGLRPVLLPHLRHNPIVGTVCHAMALDERRGWFDATTWGWLDMDQGKNAAPRSNDFPAARLDPDTIEALKAQKVREVWFSGSYPDIGGGQGDDATADIALRWMLAEAVHEGILLSGAVCHI
ncbi:MAG: phospholipase effector Tle1 domain-containing protein [Gammaproteobacteria bacterium]